MRTVGPEERARIENRLRVLALLMDSAVEIPGTGWRIGLDPVIGLIPGIGDALGTMVSAYIVVEGARLGASKWTIARMIGNIAIDTLVGTVPVLGDLFDAGFKSNVMNVRLLGIPIDEPPARRWVRNEAVA
jgi:hypothetical protein